MKEIEQTISESEEHNYDEVLKVFPVTDTSFMKSLATQLDDCIKKSSLVIQWHKNSKWVDDSYILIGKSRFYGHEFPEAIETFKYVNTKSEDDNARHEALVNLLRTFVDYKELNNAIAVSDYLKSEKLNKKNLKALYLARAHLYQQREDYQNVAKNLVLAAPLMKKNEGRGKVFFMLGQINQMYNYEDAAYDNYKRCLKSNPDYEMSFYAKLHMARAVVFSSGGNPEKARKFFKKLLKDSKNKEYEDRIYYELGMFELRQKNFDYAIDYFKKAVSSGGRNQKMKAYAYLRLGEIYYEHLKSYNLAKLYYDSTVQSMSREEPDYESIKQRQEVLADFVLQINTIHEQDSLLRLSTMDSVALNTFIEEVIAAEERQEKEEEKRLAKVSRVNSSFIETGTVKNSFGGDANGTWYFYNASQVSLGRAAFMRKWGNRVLEDHWRRSKRRSSASNKRSNDSQEDTTMMSANAATESDIPTLRKQEILRNIPFSDEAKASAYKKIEDAYYHLGKIYYFDLTEKENAAQTFDTLLIRFSQTEYKPEVLYLLFLIQQDLANGQASIYKSMLLSEFPNSSYAKIIENPNYLKESEAAAEEVREIYETAFRLFKQGSYPEARQHILSGLNDFSDNAFTDNLKLLEILIIGKTEELTSYQFALQDFIEKNPESELNAYAQLLLNVSREHKINTSKREGVKYSTQFDQIHSFVLLYLPKDTLSKELVGSLESLKSDIFSDLKLKTINLILNEAKHMFIIEGFPDNKNAMAFYHALKEKNSSFNKSMSKSLFPFVISKRNFDLFYQLQDIEGYTKFFNTHYKQ